MWARFPRTRQKLPEASLSPRRPRTPLKIATDLAVLVAAQERKPWEDYVPRKAGKSDFRRGGSPDVRRARSPNAHQAGSPDGRRARSANAHQAGSPDVRRAASSDSHPQSAREQAAYGRAPTVPLGSAEGAVDSHCMPELVEGAMASTDTDDSSPAGYVPKAPSKVFGSRRVAGRPSSLGRALGRSSYTPAPVEIRARAREPGETQSLSGDLKLLDAAATLPLPTPSSSSTAKSAFDFQSVMLDAVQSNKRDSAAWSGAGANQKGRRTSERERPWRDAPTIPRRQSMVAGRRQSSMAVRRKLMAGQTGQSGNQRGPILDILQEAEGIVPEKSSSRGSQGPRADDSSIRNMWKVSVDYKIPMDIVRAAFDLFKPRATPANGLSVPPGMITEASDLILTKDAFAEVVRAMTDNDTVQDVSGDLQLRSLTRGGEDIDFARFALWYAEHGFSEEVLLTKEQREIRNVARRLKLDEIETERMKGIFDLYDLDGNGTIDYQEFEKLLHSMLKVPAHLDLPAARVKQFWAESDINGSGLICFEEFLTFYMKIFSAAEADNVSPLEAFYRGLRPNANVMRGSVGASVSSTPRTSMLPPGSGSARKSVSNQARKSILSGLKDGGGAGAKARGSLGPTFFES